MDEIKLAFFPVSFNPSIVDIVPRTINVEASQKIALIKPFPPKYPVTIGYPIKAVLPTEQVNIKAYNDFLFKFKYLPMRYAIPTQTKDTSNVIIVHFKYPIKSDACILPNIAVNIVAGSVIFITSVVSGLLSLGESKFINLSE